MPARRTAVLRCTTALVAAGLTATVLSAVTAAPAQAASSIGGKITRSEILSRAQYWVDEGVPYNQGGYYPDPQGTKYREDCSGYVSMAWHADSSYTTWTLPDISTDISNSQLLPGDALNYSAEHVVLFGGWEDKAAGTFTYFAENNPSVLTNKYSANINGSTLAGWPTSYYQAIRYDNVVDDPARPAASGFADGQGTLSIAHTRDGQLDTFLTQSNGAVARNMETTPSGGWSGWAPGFAPENAAKSVVTGVHPDGRVEVFAVQTNGAVARRYQTSPYGAWSDWENFAPANSAAQLKVARHSDGRLSVFMLQSNGGIARKYETSVGGSWGDWGSFAPAGAASSFTVGTHADGRMDVFAVQSNGGVAHIAETEASRGWGDWTGLADAGAANTALSAGGGSNIAVANQKDGRLNVFIVQSNGAVSRNYETSVNGAWSGWKGFASAGAALTGGPRAGITPVSGTNISVGTHDDGRLDVVMLQSNGGVARNYETSPGGTWSNWEVLADAGSAASVEATAHSDGRFDVFVTQTNGALARNYETSPGGSFSGWKGFAPAGAVKTY
ncbi:hypothetical protein [Streptomyces achromogenes]|uniref:hypothetical protein n=1 Tax=Streptomyces achromogenes TaxID=67255 RepID=UPI003A80826C